MNANTEMTHRGALGAMSAIGAIVAIIPMIPMFSIIPIIPMLGAGLGGCAGESARPVDGTGFRIAVAPLTLPDITDACYRLTVTNGPNRTGQIVFQTGEICADAYGDGRGAITYIGTCDASVETMNSVTVELLDLKRGAPTPTPLDDADYVNPCGEIADWDNDRDALAAGEDPHGPCTLNRQCEANRDVLVEFSLTIMRSANQGFFDFAVNFDDIFCSAKLDCNPALLHDLSGKRSATAIVAFACSAGPGQVTQLRLSDLTLRCDDDADPTTPAPYTYVMANDSTQGQHGPVITSWGHPGVFQWATYSGEEQLGWGAGANAAFSKCYWNRAVGLDVSALDALGVSGCTLSGVATAADSDLPLGAPGTWYPVIQWQVEVLSRAGDLLELCDNQALDGGGGVQTVYVGPSTTSLPTFTQEMFCTTPDRVACGAGAFAVNSADVAQRGSVVVTSSGGEARAGSLVVSSGGVSTTLELSGPLEGFTLGEGCYIDPCCTSDAFETRRALVDPEDIWVDPMDSDEHTLER